MDIVLRAAVLYVVMVGLMRIVGRRELSSLSPSDLVLLIVLGDAIQQGLTQDDYSVTGAVVAVSTLAVLQVASSYVAYKWPRARTVIEGDPIVLVQDGKLIERNMARQRLSSADLAEEARTNGIGSLDDVKWAVLEPSGSVSFIQA
jgi:uncharacterized membrane protein YcaP (DUF421 family)